MSNGGIGSCNFGGLFMHALIQRRLVIGSLIGAESLHHLRITNHFESRIMKKQVSKLFIELGSQRPA